MRWTFQTSIIFRGFYVLVNHAPVRRHMGKEVHDGIIGRAANVFTYHLTRHSQKPIIEEFWSKVKLLGIKTLGFFFLVVWKMSIFCESKNYFSQRFNHSVTTSEKPPKKKT